MSDDNPSVTGAAAAPAWLRSAQQFARAAVAFIAGGVLGVFGAWGLIFPAAVISTRPAVFASIACIALLVLGAVAVFATRRRGFVWRAAIAGFVIAGLITVVLLAWVLGSFTRGMAKLDAAESGRGSSPLAADLQNIPGQLQASGPSAGGYTVGSCVNLSGSRASTTAITARCDATDAAGAYKVVAIATSATGCPSDVDQVNFQKRDQTGYALCLDYNWVASSCLLVNTGWKAERVSCDSRPAVGVVARPTDLLVSTADKKRCANGGIDHPVRKYTVCIARQNAH
ncbi:hypothetical protein P0W64_02325 [Tsukamurella sp. 8F]|uniref:LppU/SCO3897 family protein n=1 Tax=unclassified Tsukamurella TaxID=2633480 RepID=UPI0023B9E9C0|nr:MULTISPECIES: hypothetical protein [unclassified Tsukamurella]MDF0528644.1 hypothetical protein [Tsukamurella sp. 8J]MDF0585606.1 hypothetical protein [Tsukamurella sp. 8F]